MDSKKLKLITGAGNGPAEKVDGTWTTVELTAALAALNGCDVEGCECGGEYESEITPMAELEAAGVGRYTEMLPDEEYMPITRYLLSRGVAGEAAWVLSERFAQYARDAVFASYGIEPESAVSETGYCDCYLVDDLPALDAAWRLLNEGPGGFDF